MSDAFGLHFAHHLGAMRLDRLEAHVEAACDLFTRESLDDVIENLAFARRQAAHPFINEFARPALAAAERIESESLANLFQEDIVVERFFEEFDGSRS